MSFFAFGSGIGIQSTEKKWIESYFPKPIISPSTSFISAISKLVNYQGGNQTIQLDSPTCHALESLCLKENMKELALHFAVMECSSQNRLMVILEKDLPLQNVTEAYLKLHLLSHRLIKPNQLNLDHLFTVLPNIAWTSHGPILPSELLEKQLLCRANGEILEVYSVDKFPKMSNYIVPKDIRIADTARIRLGAYVGSGTTIMHEGFINFNAGVEGPNMIEGRISAGVFVENNTDLGGGCSTMGTLSGGNSNLISVGKHCLIGANAGLGISLGDNCTIEAGLYLTAGAKVAYIHQNKKSIDQVKAHTLSGKNNLLFRRNSQTGKIECLSNEKPIALNDILHQNT
ncbi:MAG: 2,3,4,5-tetrahydropyridine-2,6-dicarboxylate N-succinyltransferase [Endozoicomonadaceae bacterium]|nr:2,3,4,5-tetrahydropyridine-2,6-dicarboxylate N-succinyltransferase [Endozoicomonadaceae bacterium]MBE8232444.1 2,3,4,5-tetrahydropyridine-2,6-dicarboxylate N-succinyltransferase [Endozoicomonadaceae bacterium]